jgi:hypothetical protein
MTYVRFRSFRGAAFRRHRRPETLDTRREMRHKHGQRIDGFADERIGNSTSSGTDATGELGGRTRLFS